MFEVVANGGIPRLRREREVDGIERGFFGIYSHANPAPALCLASAAVAAGRGDDRFH